MAVQYRDEVLEPIVKPCATAVGLFLVLMDDNVRYRNSHRGRFFWRFKGLREWNGRIT